MVIFAGTFSNEVSRKSISFKEWSTQDHDVVFDISSVNSTEKISVGLRFVEVQNLLISTNYYDSMNISFKDVRLGNILTIDGGSEQSESIDVPVEFEDGFNNVKIISDSIGHIRATGFLDVYRQITQNS